MLISLRDDHPAAKRTEHPKTKLPCRSGVKGTYGLRSNRPIIQLVGAMQALDQIGIGSLDQRRPAWTTCGRRRIAEAAADADTLAEL